MVQGVSRQVIVVRSPDPRFFEQAIFIIKEDAFGRGASADAVLREARRAADSYLRRASGWGRAWRKLPAPAYAAGGALGATLCWLLALLL
nr:translation initiation factor 2 [uncultured Flavonifractor sp.]